MIYLIYKTEILREESITNLIYFHDKHRVAENICHDYARLYENSSVLSAQEFDVALGRAVACIPYENTYLDSLENKAAFLKWMIKYRPRYILWIKTPERRIKLIKGNRLVLLLLLERIENVLVGLVLRVKRT